jgi:hypothetical protein
MENKFIYPNILITMKCNKIFAINALNIKFTRAHLSMRGPLTVRKTVKKLPNTQQATTKNTTVLHKIHRSVIVTPIYSEQPDTIGYYNQYYCPRTQSFDASAILQE